MTLFGFPYLLPTLKTDNRRFLLSKLKSDKIESDFVQSFPLRKDRDSMRRVCSLVCLFMFTALVSAVRADEASIYPDDLTVEMLSNPVGVDTESPRLAWKNRQTREGYGFEQTEYQIYAASTLELLNTDKPDLWDSGWTESNLSIQIPYDGKPIPSDIKAFWKVRVKDQDGQISSWSAPASWTTGMMNPADWQAKWIAQPESLREPVSLEGTFWLGDPDPAAKIPQVRREFELDIPQSDLDAKKYVALLYYAGNKTFACLLNGDWAANTIGMVYNPDLLRVVDVTKFLRSGKNVLAAEMQADNDMQPSILMKLVVYQLDPADNVTPGRGTPGKKVFELSTDSSWKAVSPPQGKWEFPDFDDLLLPNAAVLWEPDGGPWGKLRRFSEATSPAFEKSFKTAEGKKVERATLFISGLGFYEASLDGEKITGRLLDPSITQYQRRVLYSVYDLTDRFSGKADTHTFNVLLGHGWYDVRSTVTWNFDAAPWRGAPRLLAQLNLHYDDGTTEVVSTDESWDCVTSPVVYDCIRQGEIVDGGFRQKTLGKAALIDPPGGKLSASLFPGSMIVHEFPAVSVFPSKEEGTWIVDIGKNIAGWCRVRFKGLPKGKVVRLRYSERVKEGEIERHDIEQHFLKGSPSYYAGEVGGFQTDFYIAGGKETEIFEPRFTYNGFKYLEVKGLSEAPDPDDFTACELSSGFPQTGVFMTSNSLINQIQAATLSSYRSNFVDGYPTDCPHREKNGWTGDAQLACELAMFNWENSAAYEKWVRDLLDEQQPNGNLPGIVPTGGWGYAWGNGPSWDSALVLIPWHLYVYRGDKRILEKSYQGMKRYVDYMTSREDADHLVSHGLGDWCPWDKMPPTQVTVSSYYYVDAKIVAATARLLGKVDEAEKYDALAARIQADYNRTLFNQASGAYSDGSITAQACPIHQGFTNALSKEEQESVFDRLLDRLAEVDYHFDCGIFGVKYILRTLSEGGRTDLALRMVLQETPPCYADWIHHGEGTLWEDWYDGSSRNHIMFGDISAWFYQYLAGIRLDGAPYPAAGDEPEALAFQQFLIAPDCRKSDLAVPGKESISSASAYVDTPNGRILSSWERDAETGELVLEVVVPCNTHAKICVPYDEGEEVIPDENIPDPIRAEARKVTDRGKDAVLYQVGSGKYRFTVK